MLKRKIDRKKGDVVFIKIPFTDLLNSKDRPGLIIANLPGNDYIVCKITKYNRDAPGIVELDSINFQNGHLRMKSYIRVDNIFTLHDELIKRDIGSLKQVKIDEVMTNLFDVLQNY